jgi:hypothetical protein
MIHLECDGQNPSRNLKESGLNALNLDSNPCGPRFRDDVCNSAISFGARSICRRLQSPESPELDFAPTLASFETRPTKIDARLRLFVYFAVGRELARDSKCWPAGSESADLVIAAVQTIRRSGVQDNGTGETKGRILRPDDRQKWA